MTKKGLRERYAQAKGRVVAEESAEVLTTMQTAVGPQGPQMDEAKRLSASHDPRRASGCRCCGLTLPPAVAEGDPGWTAISGWKTCPECEPLVRAGLGALMAALTGETMSDAEAADVLDHMPHPSPAYCWGRWPTDRGEPRRFAHLSGDFADQARYALTQLRRRHEPRRSESGRGCAWCGVAVATSWTKAPMRWGKQRDAAYGSLCGGCTPTAQRAGVFSGGTDWRPHLLALATGMRRPKWGYSLDIRAFFESGADPAGTVEAFEYLGELRAKLRSRVVDDYPRSLILTDRERRVVAIKQAMAEAEAAPKPPPLASV